MLFISTLVAWCSYLQQSQIYFIAKAQLSVSSSWVALYSIVGCCSSPFISTVWFFSTYKPYFWKHLVMTMTETKTYKKTNTKCFRDPMYAIFFKSRGSKDLKYYIGSLLVMTKTKTKTKCFQDPMYAISIKCRGFKDLKYYIGCLHVMTKTKTQFYALLGLNIFQGWIFFRSEYFCVRIFPGENVFG